MAVDWIRPSTHACLHGHGRTTVSVRFTRSRSFAFGFVVGVGLGSPSKERTDLALPCSGAVRVEEGLWGSAGEYRAHQIRSQHKREASVMCVEEAHDCMSFMVAVAFHAMRHCVPTKFLTDLLPCSSDIDLQDNTVKAAAAEDETSVACMAAARRKRGGGMESELL